MNLRFTPHVLVLALSIGASARVVSKWNVDFTLADHSPLFQEHVNEKVIPRRRAKRITASILGQEAAARRNFYNPDVGILQGKTLLRRFGSVPKNEKEHRRDASEIGAEYLTRFLESSSREKYRQEHPRCGTNGTCYPGFCDAYESGEDYEDLAVAQNAICNGVTDANGKKWEFEGCIRDYPGYPDYQLYTKSNYCGISKCLVDGGLYGACICQAYKSLCEMFGDVRKYSYDPDAAGACTIDACCQGSKASEDGRMACFELTNASEPPRTMSLSTVGALSSFVAASAVLSVFN